MSDRLVTRAPDGTVFDPASNKNVVYLAQDAVVTIGYSGAAYMYRTPTDQWVVETLTGLPLAGSGPRGSIAMHFGRRQRALDIGRSVEMLTNRCSTWWKLFQWKIQQPPQFMIAGWQRGRRRWRPILWSIKYDRRFDVYRREQRYPRHAWAEGRCDLAVVPQGVPILQDEWQDFVQRFRPQWPPDEMEQAFVSVIRSAARYIPQIGPDCMSILIYPPHAAPVARVRYLPVTQATFIEDIVSSPPIAIPAGFSPWLLTLGMVLPPSLMVTGPMSAVCGDYHVILEAPEPTSDSPLKFTMMSQHRPEQLR
ncbi:MAG: hypothetical protein ACRDJE_23670 [Dehalococcoidia bacterium]